MKDRIQGIKERLNEIVAPPWEIRQRQHWDEIVIPCDDGDCNVAMVGSNHNNAVFIANAPDDMSYLLSRIDQLQAEREGMVLISQEEMDEIAAEHERLKDERDTEKKRAEAAERFIRESEGCIECMQSYRDKEEFLHCKLYVKNIACENFDKWKWRGPIGGE